MEFDKLIQNLEKALKKPLPGREGQITMAPLPIDEERFIQSIRPDYRKGAVLMLLYPDLKKQAFVPFIKRPTYPGVHSGQIAFPGGKMEESDKDLSETALRETEEEIGVDAQKVELIGKLSDLYIPPSNFMVSPYIGFTLEKPEFSPDPEEVVRIINCPVNTLLDKSVRKTGTVQGSGGYRLKAPYYDIESEMVWGATAMMLGEFTYLWEQMDF
ncbi:NUDIX hydrolase [Cecembia lonarensis]|uniref:Putative NUDIX hydrolase n=1 Tax=Cecembia lonarensis (strain CCUG 58316 / KCTC 22772 / LW9) TaxID=1225176 RepID=K1KTQ1_CECL9|nr:CoA pyrophosphatase [Cecembia lonarensis]EKB47575.1 putative NUDIX hydrolase [Cecembia lonarensis LW9]